MLTNLTEDPEKILAKNNKPAIVVFYTSWCGDCLRSLEYEKKLSEEFKDKVTFCRMDAEEYETIADMYGVEHYPTYVFLKNGRSQEANLVEPCSEQEVRIWIKEKLKREVGKKP